MSATLSTGFAGRSTTRAAAALPGLARLQARRYARHPLFLVGAGLTLGLTVLSADDANADILATPVMPAFFLGVIGLVTAARLTASTRHGAEVEGSAPVAPTTRTAALCLACLVPGVVAAVWAGLLLGGAALWPPDPRAWWLETLPTSAVVAILAGGVVAAVGGSLLGVVVARWLPWRGASLVAAVALVVGVVAAANVGDPLYRLAAPWTIWHSGSGPAGDSQFLPGSPVWTLLFQVALCGLAVVAALAKDVVGRARLVAVGGALAVAAAVFLAFAITTGPQESQTSPVIESVLDRSP